ncbi:hypothetical protein pdam_00022972 [Pocillopora damicornis]|uniref:Elongation factor 1 beta central acidic region eukaryote domain-containing protein n=1 Tax=Pocillopora damicornis TaxID=46731 RepID=A0A3M6TF03_POCDA|nr:hypothetical protein pdam_00022972 [Pocillopora damicornis]
MGLIDMELMFDLLDTDMRGYLTSNQLQDFHESLYFSPIDPRQIEAAIRTVCGSSSRGLCPREKFMDVLDDLDRRKSLEEKISWDFKSLDIEGKGRISLKTALLLFKAVHNELFSMKTWRSFVSQREYPDADVCFDEIKMFLCNLVDGGPCEKEEFNEEERDVGLRCVENEYRNLKELEKFQEDEASLAAEERERMHQANKLKQGAERRTKRLDHEGVVALLHEDEEWDEKAAKKARQKVTATDLIQALRTKYEILRDKLLLEMLRHHIGEGMWTVLSEDEQHERLMQLKMRVQRLRKDSKLDGANSLPGAGLTFFFNLSALMGFSRIGDEIQQQKEAEKIKELEKEGNDKENMCNNQESIELATDIDPSRINIRKSNKEIEEEMLRSREKALQGHAKSEQLLIDLEKRYRQDKDAITAKLKGAGTNTMTAEQKLTEYGLILREQLRAREEGKFESAGLAVGIAERVKEQVQRPKDDRKRQEQLGKERLTQRKGRKLPRNWKGGELDFSTPGEAGLVDVLEDTVRALERKHAMERELLIYLLQGRESVQARSAAKKLSPVTRACSRAKRTAVKGHTGGGGLSDMQELIRLRQLEHQSWQEELLDGISSVLLGTEENVSQEDELLQALEEKYDTLRDKLLLEALEKQMGAAEWAHLSERERQARLAKLKLQERRLRQQGRFDDAAALLGEGLKNAETLQALLGENRQRYLERLKERLERRQKRLEEGLDPDEEDEETMRLLNEEEAVSTGNILKDLQNRFDEEKDALLRGLQEEQDRKAAEKRRQAELVRLKREKRQAEQESRFDEAALVLGLAERNRQNLEEKLRRDRERQEQLARERLARRKRRGKPEEQEDDDEPDPDKDDLQGWQDAVLKSLERKHRAEQEFLMGLLQDESSESMREEARTVSEDDRLKRLSELKGKREELDLGVKADQLLHVDILDMAAAYKFEVQRYRLGSEKEGEVNDEEVTVAMMADLQEEQDKESAGVLGNLQEKVGGTREKTVNFLLEYDGTGSDKDLISALDQKYDALKDKLLLEAIKKQLGDAEWAQLSEQERQKRLVKLKLEERRLRKEGQLDELHRLLGEGFEMDANLRKLMGENKARYEEKLKERLAKRRERLAQGLTPDDDDEAELEDGEAEGEGVTDLKAILEDMDKRYEEEKEALMRSLQGKDEHFMSERQRQAELARLKREKLKAKQEDKFITAALVLGLAEKQKAAVEERLRQDRLRQEQLARERLEQLRNRKRAKEQEAEEKLVTDGEVSVLQEAVMKALERKHQDERQALLDVLQQEMPELAEAAATMTQQQRENWLQQISMKMKGLDPADKEARHNLLVEAAVFKVVNRQKYLELSQEETVKKDDVIVSLLADLQQEQDQESEKLVNEMQDKDKTELVQLQENLFQARKDASQPNVVAVVTQAEIWGTANERDLSQALNYKYDVLKDRLLRDALMQQVGLTEWEALSENDRFSRLAQMKLKVQALQSEGKQDELKQLLGEAAAINLMSLMGANGTQQKQRQNERQQKREERKSQGMSDEEILKLEAEEDVQAEEEALKRSTGSTVQDLENRLSIETDSLLADVRGADAKFESEQHRHAQLARIRHEERQALQESSFQPSALVLGLAQARQVNMDSSSKQDQDRQKQLAQKRLIAWQQKDQSEMNKVKEQLKALETGSEPEIVSSTSIGALQEAVLKEMERKHLCELLVLERLISEEKESDLRKATQQLNKEQQQERLFELKELRKQWRESGPEEMTETADEQETILREGVGLKLEVSREELRQKAAGEGKELGPDDDSVSLLAALQQHQEQEAEYLLRDLAVKNPMVLKQLQSVHSMACKERWYDNLAACVLGLKRKQARLTTEESAEEELVEALEQKYDALKDKLLTEVLMKQMGDAEWAALFEKDRARQEQLARERIAAIKARRAANREKSEEEAQKELEEKLLKEQAEDSEIDKRNALDVEQGGLALLQEAILNEVERKHSSEQEALTDLLAKADADQDGLAAARYLTETERQQRVDELGNQRRAWRLDAVRDAMQAVPDELQTEEEKKANATRIAESRAKHMNFLKEALVLHIETKRAQLLTQGVDEEKLQEEISVLIMADLQEKQMTENNAVANILGADKDESVLARIRTDQRMARREGWMDNLAATLMGSRPVRKRSTTLAPSTMMANLAEADEEEVRLEEEQEAKLAELEAEMENEKEARKLAGATEEEIQRAMELLQKQHDAKRKAMAADVERQRNMVRQRLEAKRRKREEQQYEEDMAASIVTMAEKQFALIREKTMLRREGQKDTLNERLARRRAEREKKKAEEEEARIKEEEEATRKKAEEEAKKAEEPKQAPADYPLPGGFAMKREKTVIDVEVSKEKQQEILSSLLREHTNVGMKFERERTRQEEMLKARKERKKSRIERKQEEVATIMGLGERQKTFVEQQKKEERERQITMVRERIARVRYERTMTMREPKDEKAQGFESLLTEEEKEGLSEEEKMKRIAAKMEEKFKSEQRRVSTVSALAPPSQSFSASASSAETSEEEGPHTERASQLLDEKSRNKKLKERMASRKRERRRSVAPTSGEDGGAVGGADE